MPQFRNLVETHWSSWLPSPSRCLAWSWASSSPAIPSLHGLHGHDQPLRHRGPECHHPHRLHQGEAAEGVPLVEAATLAGERRLRPIFLTTMAAAVGVTPMILSGSKLWSPLASVAGGGLIFSMFFTLLVVPSIYVLVFRSKQQSTAGSACLRSSPLFILPWSWPPRSVRGRRNPSASTLESAVTSALDHSAGVRIARAKVEEASGKKQTARADYLPQLSDRCHLVEAQRSAFHDPSRRLLGNVPGLGPSRPRTPTWPG